MFLLFCFATSSVDALHSFLSSGCVRLTFPRPRENFYRVMSRLLGACVQTVWRIYFCLSGKAGGGLMRTTAPRSCPRDFQHVMEGERGTQLAGTAAAASAVSHKA